MRRNLRSVIGSAAVLTITGGVLAATVGTAAASFPSTPWQPDPNALGTLAFFNSSGVQVTSGNDDSHLFTYAVGSTADPSTHPGALANLEFANPIPGGVNTGTWSTVADESSNTPSSGAPSPVSTFTTPTVTVDAGGANLQAAASGFVPNTAAGYANVYQVRVYTSAGGGTGSSKYWDADVQINPATNAWTQLDGTAVGTTTTVAASPNPATVGGSVTLTSTTTGFDGLFPAGSVVFKQGSNTIGSAQSTNASGVASVSTSALPQGTDPITATFTPTNGGSVTYAGSTGSGSEVVNPAAPSTNTSLTITGNSTTGTDATLSGTVTATSGTPAGTVSFFDNSSSTPIAVTPSTVTVDGTGHYTATLTGGFAAGSHSVVAKFTPANAANFAASQSAPNAFTTVLAGGICTQEATSSPTADCTDTQNIKASIPTGTLVISTPYTASNPLDLGTLALNGNGSLYTGSKTFKCITVTDTTGSNTGFIAQADASALSLQSGGPTPPAGAATSINGENVGLTGVAPSPAATNCPNGFAPVNSYTGAPASITATNNPAAAGVSATDTGTAGLGNAPHTVLTGSANGVGTATYDGTLTLNAPTSTAPGTYNGTIVFTVSDGN